MDVDRALRRDVEHHPGQDLPVRGDDDQIGCEPPELLVERRIPHALRLEHRDAVGEGEPFGFRCDERESAAARPVGLTDDRHHRVGAGKEALEDRAREGGRAHEDDPPGGHGSAAGDSPLR